MVTSFDQVKRRYETTDKKCPTCGYVDKEGNWTSQTDGQQIVYRHICPSCDTSREHTFNFNHSR
jgi:hypothetical protein